MLRLILCATAMLVTGCAGEVVVNPSWAATPDIALFEEAFPPFAIEAGLAGQVTLECVARVDGLLDRCRATKVIPQGLGFDRASLSVTPEYRVNPQSVDGQAQKARVVFTHRYRLPDDVEPPPWNGPAPSATQLEAAKALMSVLEVANRSPGEMPLGVDADRDVEVRAMITQVDLEFEVRMREAGALAFARLLTPEQAAYFLTREGPRPPPPDLERLAETGPEVARLATERSARLRSVYCSRFDCRPPPFLSEATPAP